MTVDCLLDTHVLIWALGSPDRLSAPARERIEDPVTRLAVSAASAWEIATKHRLGKLPGGDALVAGYQRQLDRLGAEELAVTADHALLAGRLDWAHRDPFDRMLAAQSMLENLTLITTDAAFTERPGIAVLW